MPQTDKTFVLLPPVKNVRDTPFIEHDMTMLVYTPELIKAVFARRYYRNDAWGKIAKDLKIDIEHVRKAFARGRLLKINPTWADVTPLITYETVHVTPPGPKVPKKRPHTVKPRRTWSDELIAWTVAQHRLLGRSVSAIWRSLEKFYPISGGPAYATLVKWTSGTAAASPSALELFPFFETEHRPAGRPAAPKVAAPPKQKKPSKTAQRMADAAERRQRNAEARAKGRAFLEAQKLS